MKTLHAVLTLSALLSVPAAASAEGELPNADPDRSAVATDGRPLAGWHNGVAYLRDPHDNFRIYPQGRAQIDAYAYMGNGVGATSLRPSIFLKRIRPELTGEILGTFVFSIAGEFGATAVDNPAATNESSAAPPGGVPGATTGRYVAGENVRISAQATDVFVGAKLLGGLLNFQIGQFDAPFTMENRTSDKYLPFHERSFVARTVGVPTNKEIGAMVWGEPKNKLVHYSLGLFDGDGQNRLNMDGRGDVMGRIFFHPLFFLKPRRSMGLHDAQIGVSARYGSRDPSTVTYDVAPMTTQGGYSFWSPVFKGANGWTHILPSGDQIACATELRIPVSRFDLTHELVYVQNNTREALEGYQATNTERYGQMSGFAQYAMLGFWAYGKRDIGGTPGYENFTHVDFAKPDPADPPWAVQLVARYEMMQLTYKGAVRSGALDTKHVDGDIVAHGLDLGANVWFTRHVRASLNYQVQMFPDSGPPGAQNRAQAPNNRQGAASGTLGELHELSLRFGVSL